MRTARTLTVALSLLLLGAGGARANLDDFARCLTRAGARFYGTSWCPHCAAQRRMFGTAFNRIAYVECSVNGTKALPPAFCEAWIIVFMFSSASRSTTPTIRIP